MKQLKIAIRCHAHWTSKRFNINARGEGRWSLNVAKMLMDAGHFVCLITDSEPNLQEEKLGPSAFAVAPRDVKKYGKFDLYIDPAWGFTKSIYAPSKYILGAQWLSLRERDWDPSNLIRVSTYIWPKYIQRYNDAHKDQILPMPAPFGKKFRNYNPKNRPNILFPGRGMEQGVIDPKISVILNAINGKGHVYIINTLKDQINKQYRIPKHTTINVTMYYDELLSLLRCSKLNATRAHSCLTDAIFQGCPSLIWEDKRYGNTGLKNILLVDIKNSNLIEILDILLNDQEKTIKHLKSLQNFVTPHLEENSLNYFNQIVSSLNL